MWLKLTTDVVAYCLNDGNDYSLMRLILIVHNSLVKFDTYERPDWVCVQAICYCLFY